MINVKQSKRADSITKQCIFVTSKWVQSRKLTILDVELYSTPKIPDFVQAYISLC